MHFTTLARTCSAITRTFLPMALVAVLAGCPDASENTDKPASTQPGDTTKTSNVVKIGFIPSENMEEIQRNSQPLVEMMSKKLGLEVQPFVATDYTGIVEAFRAGKLDVGFMSPASYVMAQSEAGVQVILKAQRGSKPYYYAMIFTRKDSGINTLKDFKGKAFAFGDTLSTAGHIFPRKMFTAAGINPATDFDNVLFAGGHDATVLAVLNKKVAGGATYSNDTTGNDTAWNHMLKPEEAAQLKAIDFSEPIPADNICVSKDLAPATRENIQKFFLELDKEPAGQKLVQKLYRIDRFVPATDADYSGVREAFKLSGIQLKEELSGKKKTP